MPGVELRFSNPDSIKVYGTLIAQGDKNDSIFFVNSVGVAPIWRGVWFLSGCTDCLLEYVSVSQPKWGVRSEHSQPTIRYSTILAQSIAIGGYYSDFNLINSTIAADAHEADVIYLYHSNATIYGCKIFSSGDQGAQNMVGIRIIQSEPSIRYSSVDVVASGLACGIWAEESSKASIFYNLIISHSTNLAFGSFMILSSPDFVNNTVVVAADLTTPAKCLYLLQDSDPLVENCILYGDGSSQGVVAQVSCDPEIRYSDVFNHLENAVGCSASVGAISQDPLFENSAAKDYHLTRPSPCINAGDPSSPLDPDSSRADMGCYYFDFTVPVELPEQQTLPSQYVLLQVFPNPFNAQSQIVINLPSEQFGHLALYNQQGGLIQRIKSGMFVAGESIVRLDASKLSTGTYWIVLKTSLGTQTHQICLLK